MTKTTDPVALAEWVVIGRREDLQVGQPWHTKVLGQSIECKRSADGSVQAVEVNADGERGVPLQVSERYGHVWVSFSDKPRAMVEIVEFDEDPPRRYVAWGGVKVRTSPQRLVENFLDMGHFAFVHTDVLGAEPHTEIRDYQVETREAVSEVWATRCLAFQPKASSAAGEGRDVEYIYRTSGPFIALLYKTAERPGTLDNLGLLVQPMEEDHCCVWGYTLLLENQTSNTDALHFQQSIFQQDRLILEHQTPRRIPLYDTSETPARADAAAIAYRRWMREAGMRFGIQPPAQVD